MFQSVNKIITYYELFAYKCYPKSIIQRFKLFTCLIRLSS